MRWNDLNEHGVLRLRWRSLWNNKIFFTRVDSNFSMTWVLLVAFFGGIETPTTSLVGLPLPLCYIRLPKHLHSLLLIVTGKIRKRRDSSKCIDGRVDLE